MDYKIRKAKKGEWEVIRDLNRELFNEEVRNGHDSDMDLSWPQSPEGEKYYRRVVSNKNYLTLLAVSDTSKALGYVVGCRKNRFDYRIVKTGELENMFVLEEARRQGVGKKLIIELKKWLVRQGVERVFVSAYIKNNSARNFYEAVGFSPWSIGLEMKV